MNETLITALITIVLIAVTVIPYVRRFRKKESKAREKLKQMKISGLQEATMMHPQIDAMRCIGCAACIRACPEGDVLGIIEGKATIIHGAKCIGHGLCAEACPVGGIELLMAKPGRSADIPVLTEQYETTMPGMFIIGELGGLGLIKNAVKQGVGVISHIATLRHGDAEVDYDVAIIGAGPSGFAAGLRALELGLRYIILEQNDIGGTVLQYPRAKVVLTSPVELPLWGKVKLMETKKEALLELWNNVMAKTGLKVQTGEKVAGITREGDRFLVTSTGMKVSARYVVLALGRRGTPRKLGVEGEGMSKVSYRLIDAASFTGKHVLVVGGGDSAIEAAIGLAAQQGNTVTLSYRKEEFTRIKERNRQHIEDYIKRKKVNVLFGSEVLSIRENEVSISAAGTASAIPNDYVFIFAGGELPYPFLQSIGVSMHHHVVE